MHKQYQAVVLQKAFATGNTKQQTKIMKKQQQTKGKQMKKITHKTKTNQPTNQ